ncbi:MAG TPA: DsbA family protein [Magnetospirillum sp.]|nr:DsbA family protein [Magnetospirillum sp.]
MVKSVVRLIAVAVALCAAAAAHAAGTTDSFPIDQVMGKPDAPITIIEYASTTCGHCADLHSKFMPKLKAEWIDTGKARLIYRDFPTSPAGLSVGASMIAHCSGPQRYFGVLGMLMEQQEKWITSANPLEAVKKMVRLAGMTSDDVDACLAKQDLATAIQQRARDGNAAYGVTSTPTLIINGTRIEGNDPEAIEKTLKAAAK